MLKNERTIEVQESNYQDYSQIDQNQVLQSLSYV